MDQRLVPPHSLEAESSLLGGVLINNEIADEVIQIVSEGDFYSKYNQEIFNCIKILHSKKSPIDILTVSELMTSNEPNLGNLGEMAKNTPSSANAKSYAKIVKDKSILRSAIQAAYSISESAYKFSGGNVIDVVTSAEKQISSVTSMISSDKKNTHVSVSLKSTVDLMEQRLNSESSLLGIPTGLEDLDQFTSGLQVGLYLIGARPAMGKTTLLLNMITSACRNNELVVLFSIEMPKEQITMKLISSVSSVPIQKLQNPKSMSDIDWAMASKAMEEIKKWKLEIIDDSKASVASVRLDCMKIQREKGKIGMIAIDYIQLISAESKENRTQEISEISREVNSMKKEFNCPVVALSQLNRALDQRSDKRPVSSDLRESGQLEQDADVIMFLYRDEVYYEDSPDAGLAEILIRKSRLGMTGKVGTVFNGQMQRFESLGNNVLRSEEVVNDSKKFF